MCLTAEAHLFGTASLEDGAKIQLIFETGKENVGKLYEMDGWLYEITDWEFIIRERAGQEQLRKTAGSQGVDEILRVGVSCNYWLSGDD